MGTPKLDNNFNVVGVNGVDTCKDSGRHDAIRAEVEQVVGAGFQPDIPRGVRGNMLQGVERRSRSSSAMNDMKHWGRRI